MEIRQPHDFLCVEEGRVEYVNVGYHHTHEDAKFAMVSPLDEIKCMTTLLRND